MNNDRLGLNESRLKLARADKHLDEVLAALERFKRAECAIAMEKDETLQGAVQ